MFALVQDGSITKHLSGNHGITLGDIQYPQSIFTLWSVSEREAIGIYEVVFDNTNFKDETYYINTNQSFAFADGVVTASYGSATTKAHADTFWTQADSDNGDLPEDTLVGDFKVKGLKTIKIRGVRYQATGILQKTDWYIVRKADDGTAVPSAITTHRAAVRTKCSEMVTAITNAADTPAIETLHIYTEQEDGSATRPLGELPQVKRYSPYPNYTWL